MGCHGGSDWGHTLDGDKDLKTRKSFCNGLSPWVVCDAVKRSACVCVCVCVVLFFLPDSQLTPWLEA